MPTTWGRRSMRMWLLACGLLVCAAMIQTEAERYSEPNAQKHVSDVIVGPDNIGGVVISSKGPEAGVWVIAETTDFPTKLRKIVVTDDHGRFLIPEMPNNGIHYKVWVRGYGLVDSRPVSAAPGETITLRASIASNPRAGAQVYPPNYWLSMLKIPPKEAFPMKAPTARNKVIPTQADWIDMVKEDCQICHQLGDKATREMPVNLGAFPSAAEAWKRRILSGQIGDTMFERMNQFGYEQGIAMFADWTKRITAGEVPPMPPRPQGIERNIVLTLWDIGGPKTFYHSLVSTAKLNPRENPNGPAYEADFAGGTLDFIDPRENTATTLPLPLRNEDDRKFMPTSSPHQVAASSPYWGDEIVWDDPINPSNALMDRSGRLWVSAHNRKPDTPDFCTASSGNEFAKAWESGNPHYEMTGSRVAAIFQRQSAGRTVKPWESATGSGLDVYDPKTRQFETIDLCYGQHHGAFANDSDETIYFSLHDGGLGWFKTRVWNETHDAKKAQGWCAPVIDYNGDGKTGAFTMPNEPADPRLDRIGTTHAYGVAVSPVDNSVWYASIHTMPGQIVRQVPGPHPPSTCATEVYEPPFNNPSMPNEMHYRPRGIDVDTNGLVWTALAGSGELASFDRSKCKVLNGPTATGQHCPEGWKIYPIPGPMFKGTDARADWEYFNWVDRYNTLGLGENVSVVCGTDSDSLLVFRPDTKEWLTLHVPYPMGFYTRGLDGRIDDPKTGWKGRGLWAATETRVIWHAEGGKGQVPQMVHFQLRPDPLAR